MIDSTTALLKGNNDINDETSAQPMLQYELIAWLDVIGRDLEETISIAMLRDAAILLAKSLSADWYLTIAAETNAVVHVETGSPVGGGGDEATQWQFEPNEVPKLLQNAMKRRTSTVLGDWAAAADENEPIGQAIGLASAVVFPICDDLRVVGALGVCSQDKYAFRTDDMLLGESAAKIVAASYANCEAKRALEKSRSEHAALLDTVDAVVLQFNSEGIIESANRACEQSTEFMRSDLIGRSIWNSLLVFEEVESVKTALNRLVQGESTVSFESYILTKESDRRRIAWSVTISRQVSSGREDSLAFLATGIDVTDHKEAMEQLKCSRQESEEVVQQLAELREAFDEATTVRETAKEKEKQLASKMSKGQSDRRTSNRRAYPYPQLIAPIIGGRMPRRAEFKEVCFRDIGGGGLSFIASDRPTNTRCVVALGSPSSPIYLAAELVHSWPVELDGRSQFVVGCKYTSRVEL